MLPAVLISACALAAGLTTIFAPALVSAFLFCGTGPSLLPTAPYEVRVSKASGGLRLLVGTFVSTMMLAPWSGITDWCKLRTL